jgi:thymidylate synthase ThyX
MRELLNLGIYTEECIEAIDFTYYKVFKVTTPYFIYGQVSTHTQLTTVSHSARYTASNKGYWKPDEITMSQEEWDTLVADTSPRKLEQIMKEAGVVRREVFARGADMLQYRTFTIGGYTSIPTAWKHFVAQRTDKHTQLETKLLAKQLKELLWTS